MAGSARQHALYIWEKSIGNLVKILHGTRGELLLDVAVTPTPKRIIDVSTLIVFSVNVLTPPLPSPPPPISGIPSVQSLPPSPAGLCPSGPRTKW